MAFFKNLKENIGNLSKRVITSTPITSDEVGLYQLNISGAPEDHEAIYPQWFFSSRLGQPRQVDTINLRDLSKSSWVQMVLNTFKNQIYTTEWDIVVEEEEDDTDYTEDIKKIKAFLKKCNKNNQCIEDVNSESLTDVAVLDAGVWNMIYSSNSYTVGDVPIYNAWGKVESVEQGLVLKEFGQRELTAIKSVDGSTMLKQVDIHKNLLGFWQYSFKHPRQNPTRFHNDEIVYMMMNPLSYSVYGFSKVQAIQQVLELLIQGTRYNKDIFTNNAIPDMLVSLPRLSDTNLKKLKRKWNNSYKGKPHQLGFINWAIDQVHKLVESNRDLEWLDGQKWYFKLVFGVFGVSPTEAGFFENSNKSNDDGQERVTVRNALKPYFKLFENTINTRIIPEILQKEITGLKFKFITKDHVREKIEFEQNVKEMELGALTINDYRKSKGLEPYEWGDEPLRRPFNEDSFMNFGESNLPVGNTDENNSPKEEKSTSKVQGSHDADYTPSIVKGNSFDNHLVSEATGYSEFLLKTFNYFEKQALSAADKLYIEKSLKEDVNKQIGDFLKNLFNSINTASFSLAVKKFIKMDLISGLNQAEKELNVDIGFTESYEYKLNKLHAQQIEGYTINGKKWFGIKGVTKELQSKIIQTVQEGVKNDNSLKEIKEGIKDVFGGFSDWRANMIGRTETNRILASGKLLGYKESQIKGKKVWKSAIDDRTSPICKRLNGQKKWLDDDFIDPETNKAYQHPPSHPHCRSTIIFRPD